ncbi:dicarboxylate/amino acid:cation symporter [Methylomonas sp. AM2-LC]|uniref:dicarboxylate/amino acid:cation symporter n=1 Tax=Methylomonas sp. AM2-LC TaxID=3153301 RepID=UPI0032632F8D
MSIHHAPQATNRQTFYIAIALIVGICFGELLNLSLPKDDSLLVTLIDVFNVLTDIFLRLVKMIIAPLVFATLVVGMAKMGDVQTVGRIGIKALLWFFSASLFSLLLGMLLVNIMQPGSSLNMLLPAKDAMNGLANVKPTLAGFTAHMFPKSIIEAMASNEILQIVVFSMFFGIACASLGELAHPTVKLLDSLSHIMLKITAYVMHYAPVAVFSAISSVIAQNGIGVLLTYGQFIGEFYFALILLCSLLAAFATLFLGKRIWSLIRHIREPMLLAFGTASSESAYPKLLQQLERFGCDEKVCGLVLPLGYSFNLDGSMMYMTFAVLFIAQAYGIEMPLTDQFMMLLVLLFTSKGVAGVPRASLIVISATLSMFHIPEAGLLLLLGIDQILDMGRSATNVFGNSIAAALVSRWQRVLK